MRRSPARTFTNHPLWERPVLVGRRLVARTASVLGLKQPWVVQRRNPASPDVLKEFRLFAIIGTWMEEDVIEATVRNAFEQGCERVFLVDNGSPDDTVDRALAAGAELARTFATSRFDIDLAYELMNECVSRLSADDGANHIWWLWLDADEFPHGPKGLTIREHLAALDRGFRVVGARYINHYPADQPYYISGRHPLDFQPLGEELTTRTCWWWHRKHPLQRFDRGRPEIRCDIGIHRVFSTERPLLEPMQPVFLHHFPFRDKDATVRRLSALYSASEGGFARVDLEEHKHHHMTARLHSLEAVYAHDWQHVPIDIVPGCRRPRAEPVAWADLVTAEDVQVKRWYQVEHVGRSLSRVPPGAA